MSRQLGLLAAPLAVATRDRPPPPKMPPRPRAGARPSGGRAGTAELHPAARGRPGAAPGPHPRPGYWFDAQIISIISTRPSRARAALGARRGMYSKFVWNEAVV